MRTLRCRVEKLEREANTSDGPLLRLYVMPAGFRLSDELASRRSLPPRKTCTGVLVGRLGAWRCKALLGSLSGLRRAYTQRQPIATDNEEHSIGSARTSKSRRGAHQSFLAGITDRIR
jgi:hypothetical protein